MDWVLIDLINVEVEYWATNRLAMSYRCGVLALRLAEPLGAAALFRARLTNLENLAITGNRQGAGQIRHELTWPSRCC